MLTAYYGNKSIRLEKAKKKLEWQDLQSSAVDLGNKIKREFVPDIVFTPGLRGATFVSLLIGEFNGEIPVFVGISLNKDASYPITELPSHRNHQVVR